MRARIKYSELKYFERALHLSMFAVSEISSLWWWCCEKIPRDMYSLGVSPPTFFLLSRRC